MEHSEIHSNWIGFLRWSLKIHWICSAGECMCIDIFPWLTLTCVCPHAWINYVYFVFYTPLQSEEASLLNVGQTRHVPPVLCEVGPLFSPHQQKLIDFLPPKHTYYNCMLLLLKSRYVLHASITDRFTSRECTLLSQASFSEAWLWLPTKKQWFKRNAPAWVERDRSVYNTTLMWW